MNSLKDKIFAIVDVETTGGSPIYDRVIEIGIIRIEKGKVTQTLNTLIDPQRVVPPSIEMITGIRQADLIGAPKFSDISHKIYEILDGAIFIAHNARFDYGFIKNELKREGLYFNAKCLCTVRLSRKLFPDESKHDLSSIILRNKLKCENRHRAFDDAQVLHNFLLKIEKNGRGKEMEIIISDLLKENTLPQFLNEETVRTLPEAPGVYIFYGSDDEILYIGKSKNIRYRVLSHFSNDHGNSKEMTLCQQTSRVESRETCGELGALLLESELIKEFSPLYNRQLRKKTELVIARLDYKARFKTVNLEKVKQIEGSESAEILGIFKSQKQAKDFLFKSRDEFQLCGKLLGIEKGKGPCFYKELGKCNGACVGEENFKEYNERFSNAFKQRKLKAWPFDGAILIEERKDDETKHSFVLDNWSLLYDIKSDQNDITHTNRPVNFEYDSYKIFWKYLKNPLNYKKIKRLSNCELNQVLSMEKNYSYDIY